MDGDSGTIPASASRKTPPSSLQDDTGLGAPDSKARANEENLLKRFAERLEKMTAFFKRHPEVEKKIEEALGVSGSPEHASAPTGLNAISRQTDAFIGGINSIMMANGEKPLSYASGETPVGEATFMNTNEMLALNARMDKLRDSTEQISKQSEAVVNSEIPKAQGPIAALSESSDLGHMLKKSGVIGEEPAFGTKPPTLEAVQKDLEGFSQNAIDTKTHSAPGGLQAKTPTPDGIGVPA